MNKILMIDDDLELCLLVRKMMETENLYTDIANDGIRGLSMASENDYHVIILDIMLPKLDGFSILTELRKSHAVPILMLTAKDSETDKISGLRMGADDYLTKPFSIHELAARIQSLIRRYTKLNAAPIEPIFYCFDGLTIDCSNRSVLVDEIPVVLTSKEFDLLVFFAAHKGRIFTKRQIYTQVWNEEYAFDDNNIMSFISKLRKKIEPSNENPRYIQTVRGVGYRFNQNV